MFTTKKLKLFLTTSFFASTSDVKSQTEYHKD